MRKRYFVKIYELDGTYIKTFNPKQVMNEVSFSDKIGGGQGQCIVELNLPIDDFDEGTTIAQMKVVKIYEADDVNSPEPRLIYTGFVSQYTPYFREGSEGVRLTCLGLVSLLSLAHYRDGGNYTFTKSAIDPGNLIKAIIDHFNTVYSGNLIGYAGGNITLVGTNITYEFENLKWIDAIKKTAEFAAEDWWWRVGEDGEFYLQDRPATPTHLLTLGKDVESGDIVKNAEKVINRYRLTWGSGPTTTTYEDATSQTDYGVREKIETDSKITNLATADQQGNKVIADFKDPKVEARIVVNNNYDIESIKPGHTVTVRNAGGVLPANMLVSAVQYTSDRLTLTLENQLPSLADTFVAAVEAI